MNHPSLFHRAHPAVKHPYADFNVRVADRLGGWFGSMTTFWVCLGVYAVWMGLADLGVWLFAGDPFPHPFLLFISNFVQLIALPVLGVIGVRADQKREAKATADTATFTYLAHRSDEHSADLAAIKAHLGLPPRSPASPAAGSRDGS